MGIKWLFLLQTQKKKKKSVGKTQFYRKYESIVLTKEDRHLLPYHGSPAFARRHRIKSNCH